MASARAVASRNDESSLHLFASQAISLNRTFSGFRALLFRTKLLALNAEIASARVGVFGKAFGVVVKDLIGLGETLRHEVADLETVFSSVASHVGEWTRSRTRFGMYLRVVDALNQGLGRTDGEASWMKAYGILSTGVEEAYLAQAAMRNEHPALERAWTLARKRRDEALKHLLGVGKACGRLKRFLDRLNFVATQQSSFLATTARVEAAHADQTGFDLDSMAADIQGLAHEFSALQRNAYDAVHAVGLRATRVSRLIERK
jgi:hypothetical protein